MSALAKRHGHNTPIRSTQKKPSGSGGCGLRQKIHGGMMRVGHLHQHLAHEPLTVAMLGAAVPTKSVIKIIVPLSSQ